MKHFAVLAFGFGVVLSVPRVAVAQQTTCNYYSSSFQTIIGDLVVPTNGKCTLSNSGTVSGDVLVGQNASLSLEGNWTITGYVQAIDCAFVAINPYATGSTVIGKYVQVEDCAGDSPTIDYFPAGTAFGSFGPNSLIGGGFRCYGNTGPCILQHDHIGGGVALVHNKSSAPSQVNGNFIAKNLVCHNNVPAPTGSANLVAGNDNNSTEGQCLGF